VILYQKWCGNSNHSVRGILEVVVLVDGGPFVILYQRLCGKSNSSVPGTLPEAMC
jgi:hypothetical protein